MKIDYKPLIIIALAFLIRLMYLNSENLLSVVTVSAAVLISIAILTTYLIISKFTKNHYASIFSIFLLAIMNLGYDVSRITNYNELLFLLSFIFALASLYGILNSGKKYWYAFLAFPILSAYFHFSALLLIPALALFLFYLTLEHIKLKQKEVYFFGLSSVLILLTVFTFHSITEIINSFFWFRFDLNYLINAFPVYFGIFGAYYSIKQKDKLGILFLAVVSSGLAAIALGFTSSRVIFYLIFALAVLASRFIIMLLSFVSITKLKQHNKKIIAAVFLLSLLLATPSWVFT